MISQKIKAAALAAVEKKHGKLTPRLFWKEARDKSGVAYSCHKLFDWNIKSAAERYWTDRASEIIASVRVTITTTTQKIRSVAYVHDPRAKGAGYISVATLRDDSIYAQEALDAEVTRVVSLLERARELAAAVGLVEELEMALRAAMKLHSRSRRGPSGMEALQLHGAGPV